MNTFRMLAISLAFAAAGATNALAAGNKSTCAAELPVVEKLVETTEPESTGQGSKWASLLRRAKQFQASAKYRGCVNVLKKLKTSFNAVAGNKSTCAAELPVVEKLVETTEPESNGQGRAWASLLRRAKQSQASAKYRGCVNVLKNLKATLKESR